MSEWFEQKEQSAGKYRLLTLWYIYRILGKTFLKFILSFVVFFIWLFAKPAKNASKKYRKILNQYEEKNAKGISKFSSYSHILSYAHSLVDKLDIGKSSKNYFELNKDESSDAFTKYMNQNNGIFLICSHLGNIEALPSYPEKMNIPSKKMHAFMQITQNAIFHNFLQTHLKETNVVFHPTENIDLSVAIEMQENLKKGELVLMAGDRISANTPKSSELVQILDSKCLLPKGVFKFAKSMDVPIFFIACMKEKHNRYKIYLKQSFEKDMPKEFASFLQELILKYPKQWYNFYDFFEK